jgi:hypothetical protein
VNGVKEAIIIIIEIGSTNTDSLFLRILDITALIWGPNASNPCRKFQLLPSRAATVTAVKITI